jgi:uncharacterized membrane protein
VTISELATRIDRLAEVLAELTGKDVLAPSAPRGVKPRAPEGGGYRETGGKGFPTAAPIPGSGQDGNWMGDTK